MTTFSNKHVIAITGANGFIGKHLLNRLSLCENTSIRILVRNLSKNDSLPSNVIQIQGDLNKPGTLEGFLVPGCTVVNLAYSFSATCDQNITAINNLIQASNVSNIKRLIHCSTAAVYGRTKSNIVDESSACNPHTEYGKTKLAIENILLSGAKEKYECVNIRPTAVYGGPDGMGLIKLINNLIHGSKILNYLRSCLFNHRHLNLVHVSDVVAAIIFMINANGDVNGETYVVSNDFDDNNNYAYVEKYLIDRLANWQYMIPTIPIPLIVLSLLLMLRGRDSINPEMIYSSDKLRKAGFEYTVSLDCGLNELIDWYKMNKSSCKAGDI